MLATARRPRALRGDVTPAAGPSAQGVPHAHFPPTSRGRGLRAASGGWKEQLTRRQTPARRWHPREAGRSPGTARPSGVSSLCRRPRTGVLALGALSEPVTSAPGSRTSLLGRRRCRQGQRAPGADDARSRGATPSELSPGPGSGVPSSGRASRAARGHGAPAPRCAASVCVVSFLRACVASSASHGGAHPRERVWPASPTTVTPEPPAAAGALGKRRWRARGDEESVQKAESGVASGFGVLPRGAGGTDGVEGSLVRHSGPALPRPPGPVSRLGAGSSQLTPLWFADERDPARHSVHQAQPLGQEQPFRPPRGPVHRVSRKAADQLSCCSEHTAQTQHEKHSAFTARPSPRCCLDVGVVAP